MAYFPINVLIQLTFTGEQAVPPVQVFSILKSKGVVVPGEVDALQALQGRNTYDLRFTSDVTRQKGVTLLSGVEGLTVTPYERSVWVTVIHVGLEPRTCFRCGETGHEAKGCPNKKCGRCLRLGHDTSACPSEVVCSLCGKEGHVFRACPSSYVFMTKSGGQAKAPSSGAPTAPEEAPRKEGETGEDSLSAPPSPSPVVADPNPVPAPRKSPPASPINPVPAPSPPHSEADTGSPPASPINPSSSVPSPPPVSPDPETLSDDDSVVGLRRLCLTATPEAR
ncbi:putative zinc finger CCHC domain-containing protein 3-like [Apostichopus japonicus]|uniref:Putative zinc finger CCHC domain-containing protein 3-like n=1 Tax=Stichopus japonicus TaxID=307972 RepID=A0A2G8LCS2_STIJA|nr:putative zinc finger CCHC domain-containing protein 3-like [Apostichopus japonicus]